MTIHAPYRALTTAAVLAAVTLAGCGGGDADVAVTPPAPATTTVTGAAVKGIAKNARIEVTELRSDNLDPTMGTMIGSGRTDDSGRFQLNVTNYNGGPVFLRVRGRAAGDPDGATTVLCDVNVPGEDDCGPGVAFGDPITVNENFQMTSMLGSLTRGSSNTFNATAFTQLLQRRAAAFLSGSNTAAAIRSATSEVNQLAGVDVVQTTPIDLNSATARTGATPEQLTYTAMSSGILRNTNDGTDAAANVTMAVEQLDDSFADGSISAAELQTLVDNARGQLESVGETDGTGTLEALASIASTGQDYNPEPSDTVNASAIEQARALVTSVRTQVQSVLELETPAAAFGNQLDVIVGTDMTSGRLSAELESAVLTIEQVTSLVDQETKSDVLAPGESRTVTRDGITFTVQRANDGTITATISDQTYRNERVNVTVVVPNDDGVQTPPSQFTASLSGTVETIADTGVRVTAEPQTTALLVGADNNGGFDPETVGPVFDRAVIDIVGTIAEKGVDNPGSFTGTIGLSALRCTRDPECADNAASESDPERRAPTYNPTRILFQGTVSNGQSSALARVLFTQEETSARNFDPGTDFDQATVMQCFEGFFCFDQPDPNDDPSEQFGAAYSSTNFMDATLSVTAEATFPQSPSAQLTLTVDSTGFVDGTQDMSGVVLGSASMILVRGSSEALRFVFANSQAEPRNPTLTVSNAFDVEIVIRNLAQDGPLEGEIRVGTERAGVISELSNGAIIVRYDDGTFETLFN